MSGTDIGYAATRPSVVTLAAAMQAAERAEQAEEESRKKTTGRLGRERRGSESWGRTLQPRIRSQRLSLPTNLLKRTAQVPLAYLAKVP
eukprot:3728176-Rhodomonas_salina.4